jgi:predicted nucleotidyltransferase
VLADWVAPAPSVTIYLFGSRVRGDHRPDSDVDVVIDFENPQLVDMKWWGAVNNDLFRSIDAALPGRLAILERDDPVANRVRYGPVVYRDRQVVCVWTEPKGG